MKLQKTTLILLLLALGLTGFVYFFEIKGAPQREAQQAKAQQIFTFTIDQVQSFTVKTQKETLTLERQLEEKPAASPSPQPSATKSPQPNILSWNITTPIQAPAAEASVLFLLDKLTSDKSERTLTVAANKLADYGLDQPQATLEIKLKNQETHQLLLGQPDFTASFLYALVDPTQQASRQDRSVLLVPIDFLKAVDRPISEWQKAAEPPATETPAADEEKKSKVATPSPVPNNSENSGTATPSSSPSSSEKMEETPSPSPSSPENQETATPTPTPSSQSEPKATETSTPKSP